MYILTGGESKIIGSLVPGSGIISADTSCPAGQLGDSRLVLLWLFIKQIKVNELSLT